MKKIKIFSSIILSILIYSCNSKSGNESSEKEQADTTDTKDLSSDKIAKLDFSQLKFNSYRLILDEKIDENFLNKNLRNLINVNKFDLRMLKETNKDPNSAYLRYKNAVDPSGVFEVNKRTGGIVFNKGLKAYSGDNTTEGLPNEKQAIELSRKMVERLKLSVNLNELNNPEVGGLEMGVKKDKEEQKIYKKMVQVRYNRKIDGLNVEGDTRLIFSFGRKSELTALTSNWGKWQSTPLSGSEVFRSTEVEKMIEDKLGYAKKTDQQMIMQRKEIVLYDDGRGIMEPAVYVQARTQYTKKSPDGREAKFDIPIDFYQPIVKNSRAYFPHVKDNELKRIPYDNAKKITDKRKDKDDE